MIRFRGHNPHRPGNPGRRVKPATGSVAAFNRYLEKNAEVIDDGLE